MKILSIIGTRPQLIKVSQFVHAVEQHNMNHSNFIDHEIADTGQHYDREMAQVFFEELDIPKADYHMNTGSGSHGIQTARMLIELEEILGKSNPDGVVVYGDTNSTLAGALSSVKKHITVIHVEAGLRSGNMEMPEEINRIIADHISDLLFAPTKNAIRNLRKEGLTSKSIFSGDIMLDSVYQNKNLALVRSRILQNLNLRKHKYGIITLHRAENTKDAFEVRELLNTINELAGEYDLVFPIHPRTRVFLKERLPEWEPNGRLKIINPVSYLDMLRLLMSAKFLCTDSGGLQKEAYFMECPCITLRNETEWTETVAGGGNIVTGTSKDNIKYALTEWLNHNRLTDKDEVKKHFGNGKASKIILEETVKFIINKELRKRELLMLS